MEEAYELAKHLPRSFKSSSEQEYIAFLWDAFDSNCAAGKYQFAFLAYHMLTMAVIYFNVWQIRHTRPESFQMAMVGFNKDQEADLLKADTPFAFHMVNESAVVRFLKLIGCDNAKCGAYAKLVKDRNNIAHCNGNIYPTDEDSLRLKVVEVLRAVDEIQAHSRPLIEECYRAFLIASSESDEREFIDPADQVREVLVHGNYMSCKDLEICRSFDLASLPPGTNAEAVRELHAVVISEANGSGVD